MTTTSCTLTAGTYLSTGEMAIMLYADEASSSREFVAGLTNCKPPFGYTRNSFEVRQAGTYAFDVPTVPKLEQISAALDMQRNDPVHIEIFNRGKCQSDQFTDMWIYLERNLADATGDVIAIPNHVQNSSGGFSVMSMSAPSKGLDEKWTWDFNITQSITSIFAFIHLFDESTPIYTFTAGSGAGDTITRSSGSFVADGITEGMQIFIDDTAAGSDNYRKIVVVDTVTATDLTVWKSGTSDEDGYLTTDATGDSTCVLRAGYQM